MQVVFRYREEKSKIFGKISRPVAEVFVKAGNEEWLQVFMYIDSGADISLFPRQFGENLGLEMDGRKIQEIKGIGEEAIPVILTTLKLKIGNKQFDTKIAWSLIEEVPLILGRANVFDNFKIIFDRTKKEVTFEY